MSIIAAIILATGCVNTASLPEDSSPPVETPGTVAVTDALGRTVTIPSPLQSVICSGSGCLRYLVYLQEQDRVTGVDSIEKEDQVIEGRPYTFAYGDRFKSLPLIGEYRGKDDPEKIVGIHPDLIFKTGSTGTAYEITAEDADKLQGKTGIPVVAFPYGSLRNDAEKAEMYAGLRILGDVFAKQDRAEEVIAYIDATLADLERRTGDIPESEQVNAYIGGVSFAGAHGIISTEPAYPPFLWLHARNVGTGLGVAHADISREALVDWDPEYIFVDLGTLQMEGEGAVGELKDDPALQGLTAVKEGHVYGVFPYNFYATNYESVLADAYYIGKVLYPDRFADIDPQTKADEIFTFFVGKPVLAQLNEQYGNLGFAPIPLG